MQETAVNVKHVLQNLTHEELLKLKGYERTIRATSESFVACGNALKGIQDEKLYRLTHDTFEAYVEATWGWTRQRAYQLIEAASVGGDNARQAAALAKVPKEKRERVLKEAGKSGKVTAKSITEAASKKEEPRIYKDETGNAIPDSILADWQRAVEVGTRLSKLVSLVRTELKHGLDGDDPIYRNVQKSTWPDLNNAYHTIKGIIPYSVCTSCAGHGKKKCTFCRGSGFLNSFLYEHAVSKDAKAMREKK